MNGPRELARQPESGRSLATRVLGTVLLLFSVGLVSCQAMFVL